MLSLRSLSLLVVASMAGIAMAEPHIDPSIHRTLQEQSTVNIIVSMQSNTLHTRALRRRRLEVVNNAETDRGEAISNLVTALEQASENSQQPVMDMLMSQTRLRSMPKFRRAESFWITNQVFIEAATPALIEQLRKMPSVKSVQQEQVLEPFDPVHLLEEDASKRPEVGELWATARTGASDVWATGNHGENVTVAILDSGALASHEALRDSFLGDFGWYDPENNVAVPMDLTGHGTAAASIIAGQFGIGVAPGAKWMACKICRPKGCFQYDILTCAQWIMCPTDPSGSTRNCAKAPHVVNNSWGSRKVNWSYMDLINAWHAAGIIPVFANGNTGPFCETTTYPAGYPNVIGVGSTNSLDEVDDFSSKGPAANNVVKPDFVAPGNTVASAWIDSDTSYSSPTGTSFAAPHAAGAIALLLSAKPNMTYDEVVQVLRSTAITNLTSVDGVQCDDPISNSKIFPNNQFGSGRIDIFAAVNAAGGNGTISSSS